MPARISARTTACRASAPSLLSIILTTAVAACAFRIAPMTTSESQTASSARDFLASTMANWTPVLSRCDAASARSMSPFVTVFLGLERARRKFLREAMMMIFGQRRGSNDYDTNRSSLAIRGSQNATGDESRPLRQYAAYGSLERCQWAFDPARIPAPAT